MSEKIIDSSAQKDIEELEKVVIKCAFNLVNGTSKVFRRRSGCGPDKDDIHYLLQIMKMLLDKKIRCNECKKFIEWEEISHHGETCEKYWESGLPPKVFKILKEMMQKAQEESILERYGFTKENLVEFQEYFGGRITEIKTEKFFLLASKSRHLSYDL